MGTDPETHRKLLEKMFQNTSDPQAEAPVVNLLSNNGAFTSKKPGDSNQKTNNSKDSLKQQLDVQVKPDRDSIGLFYTGQ